MMLIGTPSHVFQTSFFFKLQFMHLLLKIDIHVIFAFMYVGIFIHFTHKQLKIFKMVVHKTMILKLTLWRFFL